MTRCLQYIGAESVKRILLDPAHGVALAYVASPRVTFGELSCASFCASEDKRAELARGTVIGRPGRNDSCRARWAPDSVDFA